MIHNAMLTVAETARSIPVLVWIGAAIAIVVFSFLSTVAGSL